jgi:hypothetical protein
MSEMTVTEALAEIKTVGKRLAKRRQFVMDHLVRVDRMKDPHEEKGGSKKVIEQELQGIRDLEDRIVALRSAINQVNQTTKVSVGETTRTIADWIIWRREVSRGEQQFLAHMREAINRTRGQKVAFQPPVRTSTAPSTEEAGFEVNIDEKWLADAGEKVEEILGTLDGKLSLINATTAVSVRESHYGAGDRVRE